MNQPFRPPTAKHVGWWDCCGSGVSGLYVLLQGRFFANVERWLKCLKILGIIISSGINSFETILP